MAKKIENLGLKILRDQYALIFNSWQSVRNKINSEPSAGGIPNITKDEVDSSILSLNSYLNSDQASMMFNPIAANPYTRGNHWQTQAQNIVSYINQLPGNSAMWQHLVDHLHGFTTTINLIFGISANLSVDKNLNSKLNLKLGQIESYLSNVEDLNNQNTTLQAKLTDLSAIAQSEQLKISELSSKIEKSLESLANYEKGLNQKGLAESFRSRVKDLKNSMKNWMIGFSTAILIISSLTLGPTLVSTYSGYIPKDNKEANQETPTQNVISKDSKEILLEMLIRILISSPMIWMAWFCAKQYSATRRLKEEYEYKTSSAEAFYGYHQQATVDEDLKKLLLEGIITNFNQNPSIHLDTSKHKVSPVEESVSELLKKIDPGALYEALKQIKPS